MSGHGTVCFTMLEECVTWSVCCKIVHMSSKFITAISLKKINLLSSSDVHIWRHLIRRSYPRNSVKYQVSEKVKIKDLNMPTSH